MSVQFFVPPKLTKLAVVGYGYWGQKLVGAAQTLGAEVAVVDRKMMVLSSPLILKTWAAVLKIPEIRGIIIATPEKTHASLAIAALQAGKAVLIEKPATTKTSDWKILMKLAAKNHLPLMVDYTFLSSRAFEVWQNWQTEAAPQLGKWRSLTAVRHSSLSVEKIADKEIPIWWDMAIHDFYLLRSLNLHCQNYQRLDQQVLAHASKLKITTTAKNPVVAMINSRVKFQTQLWPQLQSAQIPTTAPNSSIKFVADYSWTATTPVRSWRAEFDHGELIWDRVSTAISTATGQTGIGQIKPSQEKIELRVKNQSPRCLFCSDTQPSPLETLLKTWASSADWSQLRWQKYWAEITIDMENLEQLDKAMMRF